MKGSLSTARWACGSSSAWKVINPPVRSAKGPPR
jgi:hypothetical protein